jgi:predicted metal-dependent hydrolase
VHLAGRSLEVNIRRHRAARRYTLRLADDGGLRLTVPRWASVAEGLRFVSGQADWIQRERLRQAVRRAPWRDGTLIWYRGERVRLTVSAQGIAFGDARLVLADRPTDLRGAVEAHVRAQAAAELPARCRAFATQCGLAIASVRVRNQQSRWGACSARGAITLNWRLLQMPPSVADYIIFHELMHLRQPNHSRRFWREVAQVCPWWREAEAWLRRWGKELV